MFVITNHILIYDITKFVKFILWSSETTLVLLWVVTNDLEEHDS
jgi:hypothetical protein